MNIVDKNSNVVKKYITLYGSDCAYEDFVNCINKHFGKYNISFDSDWIKFKMGNTLISINTSSSQNNAYFQAQAKGMCNLFSSSKMPNSNLKKYILQKISKFNCIYGFMVEENSDDNTIINSINITAFKIAKELNLFVLHPNMNLYSPDGKLFISFPSGKSEFVIDANSSSAEIRRKNSNSIIKSLKIDCLESLPVIEDSTQITLKAIDDIYKRAITSLLSAQFACDINDGNYDEAKILFKESLLKYEVQNCLNPKEKRLFDGNYTEQDIIDVCWEYETFWAIAWCLGLTDDISDAENICDCKLAFDLVNKNNAYTDFCSTCKLRDIEEILDMLDLYYRYHWAIVEKRINPQTNIGTLNPDIVVERRRGLEWIVCDTQDWYDISLDT